MARRLVFVTSNANKLKEVKEILSNSSHALELTNQSIDLPEYQGERHDICKSKCRSAAEIIKGPVIIEDTSLCFHAFGGLPGPYVKWFLEKLGPSGLHRLLHGFDDKSAAAVCTFAYCQGKPEDPVILFEGVIEGRIVEPRGGTKGFSWDPCFQPDGYDKTFAEMEPELKNSISHRSRALFALKEYFEKTAE